LMLLAIIVFVASCTVEKRRYTDGYHVEWRSKREKPGINKSKDAVAVEQSGFTQSVAEEEITEASPSVVPNLNPAVAPQENKEVAANEKIDKKAARKLKRDLRKEIASSELAQSPAAHEEIQKISEEGEIQTENSTSAVESSSAPEKGVLILLCILIPPVAVYLYEGSWTSRCTINLILSLLCWLPGIIHALVVVNE
jgi:uncharacterized membrane protein YqaE (UPF0057 family)